MSKKKKEIEEMNLDKMRMDEEIKEMQGDGETVWHDGLSIEEAIEVFPDYVTSMGEYRDYVLPTLLALLDIEKNEAIMLGFSDTDTTVYAQGYVQALEMVQHLLITGNLPNDEENSEEIC